MKMKIRKYLHQGLLLIGLVITFSSCEEFLDKRPALETTNELSLSTFNGLVTATNAAYAPLYSSSWYGRDFTIISDLKGGNCKASPINTGRFRYEYTWTNNNAYTSALWSAAYQAITRACNVLEFADQLKDPTATEAGVNQLKGECLFIRALGHFDLIRMYAQPYTSQPQSLGVPIITKTELSYPKRATVAEVYTQIVNDLKQAVTLLPNSSRTGSNGSNAAFARKNSAIALLAKVYLYMGNWQEAANNATTIIKGDYTLYNENNFLSAWGKNEQSEIIFEVYGKDGQEYYPNFDEIGNMYSPDGYGDICATNDLLNLFEPTDVRLKAFRGHASYTGYTWPTKYPGKSHIRENNIPVLRLAEMYLIRAEAVLNGATGSIALNDYNSIRTKRGLAAVTTVSLQDIYNERRRELCFEGNQLWDLSRTKRNLNRDEKEIFITETANIDINFPDYKWAMPIPTNELDVNPNLEPNPGYSN